MFIIECVEYHADACTCTLYMYVYVYVCVLYVPINKPLAPEAHSQHFTVARI